MHTSFFQNSIASMVDWFPNSAMVAEALPDPTKLQVISGLVERTWGTSMILPIILGAVGYLLIQYGMKSSSMLAGGVITLVMACGIALGFVPVSLESYMLMAFCALATGGGISFLVAREPVYAALGFATAVLSTCGILFMQSALFIAAATMIVYAGATIIIFLFVLMFAQQTDLRNYDIQMTNPWLAATISAILLATITMCVTEDQAFAGIRVDLTRPYSLADMPESFAAKPEGTATLPAAERVVPKKTSGLGRALYTDYLLAVELAGTVLLVATIGAIALAQRTTEGQS